MVEVESPRGPRLWLSIRPGAVAGRVVEKAARLLGDREEADFYLSDCEHRVLERDEPVVDGESYTLVATSGR